MFLQEMEQVVPWAVVRAGGAGRPEAEKRVTAE